MIARRIRRFKHKKILFLMFILLFLFIFFVSFDDPNMSSKFANELRDTGRLFERTTKSHEISNANVRFNEKFRNLREKNVHSITKTIDTMKRIVHLDLKGSAPKLTYLVDLIPYFKRAGATGVLIEYEDFFPYENDLESIRNQNHYTKQEINQLIKFLKESNLEVIPLIQTYGHLEFVLKLKQFSHLREDKKHFQTISPCVEETYNKVLFPMIDQILATHPEDLQSIHIGCDEVLLMNKNPACSDITDHNDMTTQDWFILHVSKVINYIKKKRPHMNVMIWDDMIRNSLRRDLMITPKLLRFTKTVTPMVWDYNSEIQIPIDIWNLYDRLFNEIWIASAYKGATNHLELMPNVDKHYKNQLSWINFIEKFKSPLKIKGITFTGWSRYDHMQSVCEIMPAALPSLALCLQTFANYDMIESFIFTKAREVTECNYNDSTAGFLIDPYSVILDRKIRNKTKIDYSCQFPGDNIYRWILHLKLVTQFFEFKHERYEQVLNAYNLKNNFFNTIEFEQTLSFYKEIRDSLKAIEATGEKEFDRFYYSDLYEEINQVYIVRYVDIIDKRLIELNKIVLPESAPNRPFNKISMVVV